MTGYAGFDVEAHAGRLARDGFTLIEDFLSPGDIAEARARIEALSGVHRGRNAFEGFAPERASTPLFRAGRPRSPATCRRIRVESAGRRPSRRRIRLEFAPVAGQRTI